MLFSVNAEPQELIHTAAILFHLFPETDRQPRMKLIFSSPRRWEEVAGSKGRFCLHRCKEKVATAVSFHNEIFIYGHVR